jgi:hypothetical protein
VPSATFLFFALTRISAYLGANATRFVYLFHILYRYSMEVDDEKIYTYRISVGVCLWFCQLDVDVGLHLGCIGAVLMRLY